MLNEALQLSISLKDSKGASRCLHSLKAAYVRQVVYLMPVVVYLKNVAVYLIRVVVYNIHVVVYHTCGRMCRAQGLQGRFALPPLPQGRLRAPGVVVYLMPVVVYLKNVVLYLIRVVVYLIHVVVYLMHLVVYVALKDSKGAARCLHSLKAAYVRQVWSYISYMWSFISYICSYISYLWSYITYMWSFIIHVVVYVALKDSKGATRCLHSLKAAYVRQVILLLLLLLLLYIHMYIYIYLYIYMSA